MTINIFVLKGGLNGKNRRGAFLFLSGILKKQTESIIWVRKETERLTMSKIF